MAADKFNCPKCEGITAVINVVQGRRETTRYRHCRICAVNFATTESVKDTPRVRSWLGEAKAEALFPPKPFKYRTIKQQNRVTKSTS